MNTQLQTANIVSPGADLNAYMATVNSFSILTPDEERSLAERLYYDGDLEAARQMVMAHLRFVVHLARTYKGYGLAQGDLIQEGNVGLMKAVKRFNPEKGVRLVSFAVHWIKAEMHEYILRNWRIVKIATTKAQRKLFFNLRSSKKSLSWLSHDEAKLMADDLGVSVKDVQQMEGRLTSADTAFDTTATDDDSDSTMIYAPVNYLEDHSMDPALMLEDSDWEADSQRQLAEALDSLDVRSRDILASRWLGEKKQTLHELAARYDVSAERIRQLEKNAMKKLKVTLQA